MGFYIEIARPDSVLIFELMSMLWTLEVIALVTIAEATVGCPHTIKINVHPVEQKNLVKKRD